eukprot:2627-Eustigmatos_ZCMA.PRE.1
MHVAGGVQRQGPALDAAALAAEEIAFGVEDQLVGVHVGEVRGDGHRALVVVEHAGHEVAEDAVGRFEHLVHGRRPVEAAGDRREVADVECVGVVAAEPADHVEGMALVDVARPAGGGLQEHLDF